MVLNHISAVSGNMADGVSLYDIQYWDNSACHINTYLYYHQMVSIAALKLDLERRLMGLYRFGIEADLWVCSLGLGCLNKCKGQGQWAFADRFQYLVSYQAHQIIQLQSFELLLTSLPWYIFIPIQLYPFEYWNWTEQILNGKLDNKTKRVSYPSSRNSS